MVTAAVSTMQPTQQNSGPTTRRPVLPVVLLKPHCFRSCISLATSQSSSSSAIADLMWSSWPVSMGEWPHGRIQTSLIMWLSQHPLLSPSPSLQLLFRDTPYPEESFLGFLVPAPAPFISSVSPTSPAPPSVALAVACQSEPRTTGHPSPDDLRHPRGHCLLVLHPPRESHCHTIYPLHLLLLFLLSLCLLSACLFPRAGWTVANLSMGRLGHHPVCPASKLHLAWAHIWIIISTLCLHLILWN